MKNQRTFGLVIDAVTMLLLDWMLYCISGSLSSAEVAWGDALITALGILFASAVLWIEREPSKKESPEQPPVAKPQLNGVPVLDPLEALGRIVVLYDGFTAAQAKDGVALEGVVNKIALGCLFTAAVDIARASIANTKAKE